MTDVNKCVYYLLESLLELAKQSLLGVTLVQLLILKLALMTSKTKYTKNVNEHTAKQISH